MSICWYLPVKPVLHIPEVIDIGVNRHFSVTVDLRICMV